MASVLLQTLKTLNTNKHNVGSINNWNREVVNQGAKVSGASIDNFELVDLGFNADGERICTSLADTTKKGYLIASVEDYVSELGETISGFYNEVGETARIFVIRNNSRLEASNFVADNTAKAIKNGQVAHYDATTKKFIISNDTANNADYATAGNKFIVVDANPASLDGQALVRFEAIA